MRGRDRVVDQRDGAVARQCAPVGILSGRGPEDGYCFYSQAVNAEYELRVPIYLGG